VQNLTALKQSTVNRLNKLPPHRLAQALDYIDYLLEHPEPIPSPVPESPKGNLDDLLACAGSWQFEPGELEEILQDIDHSRLMELEEAYDGLPA
jgi:hypothetical protein